MRLKLFLFFILISISVKSQNNFSVKLFGFSFLPSEQKNTHIKPERQFSDGKVALEAGIILGYEWFIREDFVSMKISQTLFDDRAGKLAGATSLMFRARIFKSKTQRYNAQSRHSIYIGLGSALFYRKNWSEIEGYEDENIYKDENNWQYKFGFITGEIEYNFAFSKTTDISLSINHIHPEGFTLALGLKFWISKKIKNKPCNCPSFH